MSSSRAIPNLWPSSDCVLLIGHVPFKWWDPIWESKIKILATIGMKVSLLQPSGVEKEIVRHFYICMLDIDLRRGQTSQRHFLCIISIYSSLTFELWAEFPSMKVPAGLRNNSQAFLLFPSLSRISHEALSCLINSFSLVRKKPTELASARLPTGSKWISRLPALSLVWRNVTQVKKLCDARAASHWGPIFKLYSGGAHFPGFQDMSQKALWETYSFVVL